MQDNPDLYDVIIIGGGPAGLTAAQYAARAKLKVLLLDKSRTAGALAYSSKIENYPGLATPISGKELLDLMRDQAGRFGAQYLETQVIGVNFQGEIKEIVTMDKTYAGKTVIIATGSMGRKPSLMGEAEFLGKGVSYCAICDAAFFREKEVCVIGKSEEAVKEAGVLARFAKKVYLIVPSETLDVEDRSTFREAKNVEILFGHTVTAIEGTDTVERIRMLDHEKNEASLDLSGVFVYLHGNKPVTDFLPDVLQADENGCISVNNVMETSIAGVCAAGDVTCTEVRQVIVAASQGCLAALSAEKYLYKRKKMRMDWGK